MKQILISGCGWYGWPLAEYLTEKGYTVHGSTTSEDKVPMLKKNRINGFLFRLTNNLEVIPSEAVKSDYLIFNIPPGSNSEDDYNFSFEVRRLIQYLFLKNPKIKIIFISSTSVLDDFSGLVDEHSPSIVKQGNGALLAHLEQWIQTMLPTTTILRFAGLYGDGRHPAKYLAGRTGLKNGALRVNLTHLDDALGATIHVLKNQIEGEIIHVCADDHPSRKQYYTKACEMLKLPLPEFLPDDEHNTGKIIDNTKLTKRFEYSLIRKSCFMGID
jgi:nucleoside-diphosphate-sugar epimerase